MLHKVGYEMTWLGFRALRLFITLFLAAVLAILVALTIFLYSGSEGTLPHPIPMPNTPVELATLPTRAEIRCRGTVVPVAARDFVSVWARPGVDPDIPSGDSDSTYWRPVEETHPQLGRLLQCTEVEVTNYAWSELGGEFYVYVEAVDAPLPEKGQEFWERIRAEQAPGWVLFDQLDFR